VTAAMSRLREEHPALPEFAVIAPVAAGVTADPAWMTTFARHVEACGFESIVAVEHTVLMTRYSSVYPYDQSGRVEIPADCPVPDPLDLLAFLAASTTTLRLATGVLVLPNHHPVVLAKRVATLDALSAGRVRLAVGMGWLREEIEACGAPFESRGRRADEQIEVLRLLWEDRPDGADHHGEFFQFAHAACHPKPVGRIPIHVGGAELTGLVTVMREEAERADRDPDSLELTLGHLVTKIDAERAGRLAELGADRVVLAMPSTSEVAEACDLVSECARRLGLSSYGGQERSDPGRQR
jgi:probable F420-dependent oxidoreductase